jgi:translation initiation factor 2 beta subunit (eIF-2beta)/eIF-5
MGLIDRSERIYSLGMKLRQIGRVQFGRIFGTEPNTSGRYKAMIDLLERCYFMRAEINAVTKLLIDKGVFSSSEFQKEIESEMEVYFKDVAAHFPEIEFRDDGFTIKDTQAFHARTKSENWPP